MFRYIRRYVLIFGDMEQTPNTVRDIPGVGTLSRSQGPPSEPNAQSTKKHTADWDAAALIEYLGTLVVPSGDCAGQRFEVLPWERKFLRGVCGCTGDAGLTISRANGKSEFVATLAAAAVDPDGPLNFGRADVVCCASSFAQGKIIFDSAMAFLRQSHNLNDRNLWRVQDSANSATIEYKPTGTRVRCIGSDPKRAHGLRPALILADEPAQFESAKTDAMLAALRTGLGKVPGSRLIALGTRPASASHWFARMLDAPGLQNYSQEHRAPDDAPPFQVKTWKQANPSLSIFPSLLARIRKEAADAKRDASLLPSFKALRLNQGTSDVSVSLLLEVSTWARIEGDAAPEGACYWGADMGTSSAMSAIVAYWPTTGLLRAVAAFPRLPGLNQRGIADGVGSLYEQMHDRGELILAGDRAVSIVELVTEAAERFGVPELVACDRWRDAELLDALNAAEIPVAVELRGQGFKDGGEDVRLFRRACVSDRVIPEVSLLMRSAMSEARTVADPAGNEKLAKNSEAGRRMRARDDAAAAAILAVSAGERTHIEADEGPFFVRVA